MPPRGVSKISSFKVLSVDGNQICSGGVEIIQKVLEDAGKELGRKLTTHISLSLSLPVRLIRWIGLEDNDEDGEDDLEEVEDEDVESTVDSEPTGLENAISNLHVS
jgi:hypothetical protein